MKTLIVYDSYFGNTKKIAYAIGEAFDPEEVRVIHADEFTKADLEGLELLIVGSPTRAFQPTKAVKGFLSRLERGALNGIKVMAFDTRMDVKEVNNKVLNVMVKGFGYAAEQIAKKLQNKGGELVKTTGYFFVKDSEGPLKEGEEERAKKWAEAR